MIKDFKKEKIDFADLEKFYSAEGTGAKSKIESGPHRSIWRRLLTLAAILFISSSVIAWLSFYVFGIFEAQQKGRLEISIEAPARLSTAEAIIYRLVLKNDSIDALSSINLSVNYPDGFILDEASLTPDGTSQNNWAVASLDPKTSKEILLRGRLLGEPGSLKTISADAKYRLPNFRSDLATAASATTALDASKINLQWEGPIDADPNKEVTYSLIYEYKGEAMVPKSELLITVPSNFSIKKTEPGAADPSSLSWPIDELKADSRGELKLTGIWQSGSNAPSIIEAKLRVSTSLGSQIILVEKETQTVVTGGDVSLRLTVNGTDKPAALRLGETMKISLQVENTSDKTITDVEINLAIQGGLVDWPKLVLIDGADVNNQIITWTGAKTMQLKRLQPKSSLALTAELPLKMIAPSEEGSWEIIMAPSLTHHGIDDQLIDRTYEGAKMHIPVSSPLGLSVEARYFAPDGSTLGAGPLPPKQGATTRYRLIWKLAGAIHKLTDLSVEAVLPDQVKVVPETSATAFGSFAVEGEKPTWRVESVEAGIEPTLEFSIELTPTKNDVGKILILSGQTTVRAHDDSTQGDITVVGTVATTNLDSDAVGRGQGVVESAD